MATPRARRLPHAAFDRRAFLTPEEDEHDDGENEHRRHRADDQRDEMRAQSHGWTEI